jgi:hypothetical protein
LSFFDDAADRAAKRRKLLSEEVGANGGVVEVHPSEKKIETEAIPLQESSMFTGATKFEDDIEGRPEEISVDNEEIFKSMPVENFGSAMLRGMGWAPGKPVGGTVKAVIEPYIPVTRGGRMGIGAFKALEEVEEADKSEKEKKERRRRREEEQQREGASSSSSSSSSSASSSSSTTAPTLWVGEGIRVRVVDETSQLDSGKRYGEKGVVNDVLPDGDNGVSCTLVMDSDGATVTGAKGIWLSTALPKKGGRVRIVGGHVKRDSVGVLLKRDKKKQVATVQLDDAADGTTLSVAYDDVSELVFE